MITFQTAKDLATEYGAKIPRYDETSPAAQCWIDRIAYISVAAERGLVDYHKAIAEADRYAG